MTPITLELSQLNQPLFSIHAFRDTRDLEASLKAYGPLHPLLVVKRNEEYHVVDGLLRLEALLRIGKTQVPCLLLDESLKDSDLLEMWFDLHGHEVSWNAIEQARMLHVVESSFSKVPSWFWKKVSFKKNIRAIHLIRDLVKLPESIQKHIATTGYSPFVAAQFLRLPKDDIEKTAARLFQLPLNQNRLGEILQLLADVSLNESVLPSVLIDQIFKGQQIDLPQKKEAYLRQTLKAKKNPLYTEAMEQFEKNLNALDLPQSAQVQPAPFFEDDYLTITAKIKSTDDLSGLIQSLQSQNMLKLLWWR